MKADGRTEQNVHVAVSRYTVPCQARPTSETRTVSLPPPHSHHWWSFWSIAVTTLPESRHLVSNGAYPTLVFGGAGLGWPTPTTRWFVSPIVRDTKVPGGVQGQPQAPWMGTPFDGCNTLGSILFPTITIYYKFRAKFKTDVCILKNPPRNPTQMETKWKAGSSSTWYWYWTVIIIEQVILYALFMVPSCKMSESTTS